MRNLFLILFVGFAFCAAPEVANAARVSPVTSFGIDYGGDTIADLTFSDGTKSSVQAGHGLSLAAGTLLNVSDTAPHTFELQTTIGLKWGSGQSESKGKLDFYRWPVEVISFYHNTKTGLRLGAGITYQFSNQLKASGEAAGASASYKNSTGFVFQIDEMMGPEKRCAVGLRGVVIQYEPERGGPALNGNSYGLTVAYLWP